jgi:hypothetical protein
LNNSSFEVNRMTDPEISAGSARTAIIHLPDYSLAEQEKLAATMRRYGVGSLIAPDMASTRDLMTDSRLQSPMLVIDPNQWSAIKAFTGKRPHGTEVVILKNSENHRSHDILTCSAVKCQLIDLDSIFSDHAFHAMVQKFKGLDLLGLEKYMPAAQDIPEALISTPGDKLYILEVVEEFISKIGWGAATPRQKNYGQMVARSIDELVLNAVFHANPRYRGGGRSDGYKLADEEAISVRWGYDGDTFGFSVSDPFGRLERSDIVHSMCSPSGMDVILGQKSAGLGLKIVREKSHHLIYNVIPGSTTEVIGLLRFDSRLLDFERRPKSVRYYFGSEGIP